MNPEYQVPSPENDPHLKDLVIPPAKDDERETKSQAFWEQALRSQPSPTNDDLRSIIEHVKPLKEQAARLLLAQNPSNKDLCYIISNVDVEPLREQAGRQLLAQNPSPDDLRYIIWHVEPLREQAQSLVSREINAIREWFREYRHGRYPSDESE